MKRRIHPGTVLPHTEARCEALTGENAVLKGLNAALRQRVAAVVLRCEELERGLAADCERLHRELAVTRGLLRDDVDRDEFYEAALAFAAAHLESDRLDLVDDSDDPDISEARWTEACARYNETKAALVAAYLALPSGAERSATNAKTLSDEGKALEVSDAAPDSKAVDAPQTSWPRS